MYHIGLKLSKMFIVRLVCTMKNSEVKAFESRQRVADSYVYKFVMYISHSTQTVWRWIIQLSATYTKKCSVLKRFSMVPLC